MGRSRGAGVVGPTISVVVAAVAGAVVALLRALAGAVVVALVVVRPDLGGGHDDRDHHDRHGDEQRADQLAAHDRYSPAEPSQVSPSSVNTVAPSSGRKRPAACHQRTTTTLSVSTASRATPVTAWNVASSSSSPEARHIAPTTSSSTAITSPETRWVRNAGAESRKRGRSLP